MKTAILVNTDAPVGSGADAINGYSPTPTAIIKRALSYPQLRFMGSKHRLLPWIHEVLQGVPFETALDAFSGSGCVAYLMKAMGKSVTANDFLRFSFIIAQATVANSRATISDELARKLVEAPGAGQHFIEHTFRGIFYTPADLRFLDLAWWNIQALSNPDRRALALSALVRSCVKRQPRGVFTVAGDPDHYKDGRRDLLLPIRKHFLEQLAIFNAAVFSNARPNRAMNMDVFEVDPAGYDLVYLDPPYVPRADDNCYMKRYHFLEGLVCYWRGVEILADTRVKKIKKPYTPFSYRRDAEAAFGRLFEHFSKSILVLSYSSNGYPDLPILTRLMRRYKKHIHIHRTPHHYHFGTHNAVRRDKVEEYLVVGT